MTTNPFTLPIVPILDWLIIERLDIKSKIQKGAKTLDIVLADGKSPQNIRDIEEKRNSEVSQYTDAHKKMLSEWDEHPHQGIIRAVGPGRFIEDGVKIPMTLKVGQHILYRGQTGEPVIWEGKLYWMIKEYDVFAVVKSKSKK